MNTDSEPLSSEQALDDYFTSLLGLEDEFDFDDNERKADEPVVVAEPLAQEYSSADQESELQWQPERKVEPSQPMAVARCYDELIAEAEQPDLQHLEKLFSELQSQPDCQIAEQSEIMASQTMVAIESFQETNEPVNEEIQSWDIDTVSETQVAEEPKVDPTSADTLKTAATVTGGDSGIRKCGKTESELKGFRSYIFDVNGVTFAVPLDELGGIHQLGDLNHLIGKPAWYLGLQSSRDNQLDVVDTAMWVMPDVLNDDTYKDRYEYVVMMGESNWGLAATVLKGTELLRPEAVRWREKSGKRPWLAGMVKEQMCALVHVSELIDMLNAGLDVKSVQ